MQVKGDNLRKALDDIGNRILLEARLNIDKTAGTSSGQEDTGRLRKSLFFDIKEFNDKFQLRIGGNNYSQIIDEGRGKTNKKGGGRKLRKILEGWVVRNRMRLNGGGINRRGNFASLSKSEVNSLAFVISRKIHNQGFKGSGFLQKAFKQTSDYVDVKLTEAYQLDLTQELDVKFAEIKQLKKNFK